MSDGERFLVGRIVIERWLSGDDDIIETEALATDGSPLSVIEKLGMLELAKGNLMYDHEEGTDHEG